MPVSISSIAASPSTVLPTSTGTGSSCSTSSSRRSPRSERETWRAVVTVDWTTKYSAPASLAIGAKRFVFCGVALTAATPPWSRIFSMRRATRSSRSGCE